ncbi:hypothetical protein [Methanobrevibacter curvatus]|uniref:Uncharacterized protein n=1 Tax=Methanobrevibacter curvatus TaxID=49547 RepID=A0A165ZSQ3_9EURY|nr:hypothetical protein [Methanobrevibacter curvatus]KZX11112.1 hypothetical protein MBCUR_15470 [Methanobrevibacter curvatus]
MFSEKVLDSFKKYTIRLTFNSIIQSKFKVINEISNILRDTGINQLLEKHGWNYYNGDSINMLKEEL